MSTTTYYFTFNGRRGGVISGPLRSHLNSALPDWCLWGNGDGLNISTGTFA